VVKFLFLEELMENIGQANVHDFFDKHGQEGADVVEKTFDDADSQQRVNLTISGRYRMKATTFCYTKDNVFKMFPNIEESSRKKALMLTVPLRVVDGTQLVPKGATIFHNITLAPAPGAKQDTVESIANISKPQLVALYGKDDVHARADWFIENCLPVFEQDGEKHKLIKDHNLQNEVMVDVVDDYYNNRETLKVKSIVPAGPKDISISNVPKSLKEAASDEGEQPDVTEITDETAENIASSVMDETPGDDAISTDEDVIDAGADKETPETPAGTEDF